MSLEFITIRQLKWIIDSSTAKTTETGHDIGSIVWTPCGNRRYIMVNIDLKLSHLKRAVTMSPFVFKKSKFSFTEEINSLERQVFWIGLFHSNTKKLYDNQTSKKNSKLPLHLRN